MSILTEADTCSTYVLPNLHGAGWTDDQITEQKTFTDGRIILAGSKVRRGPQKRADYLLRYRRDFPIAVVEAKSIYKKCGDGLQQAKDYAEILGLMGVVALVIGLAALVGAFVVSVKLGTYPLGALIVAGAAGLRVFRGS
jgi:type I site-specific restriction endonuclease